MIKKLDKLILKAFIGPFIVTFFIAFFILMMQTLWKYIDDLVGKDLDFFTIAQFLYYASASMLLLAFPIAILISSIMTFGNLGERFELVAIKSSGISLLRFMRPLIWVCMFLCIVSFLFANYVVPYANLKFKTIYFDITFKKPALELKEGAFFSIIPGYSIKIGKKEKDQKTIHDVVVYEQQGALQDNWIVAEKGTMQVSEDKHFLEFVLQNGCRYQERGNMGDTSTEFIRMNFKQYKKVFDVSSLKMNKTSDSAFKNDFRMLSVVQLNRYIDSLSRVKDSFQRRLKKEVGNLVQFQAPSDLAVVDKKKGKDTYAHSFADRLPDSVRMVVMDGAINLANSLRNSYQFTAVDIQNKSAEIRWSEIEWHRKFSLSLSCLVLFFIGAPLGSIIRRGGMGLPLVVALACFVLFHLLNIFGEKFSREGLTSIFFGMWLSVFVLVPVGFFFTYKAMHDSQLFNKEYYLRLYKKVRSFLRLSHK